jgi:hypothetical protein
MIQVVHKVSFGVKPFFAMIALDFLSGIVRSHVEEKLCSIAVYFLAVILWAGEAELSRSAVNFHLVFSKIITPSERFVLAILTLER